MPANGAAKGLFDAIDKAFDLDGITYDNLLGYCFDNTITVAGNGPGSVKALLKGKQQFLFTLGCTCHSAALVSSAASDILPAFIKELCQDLNHHFNKSSKRLSLFKCFQVLQVSTGSVMQPPALSAELRHTAAMHAR